MRPSIFLLTGPRGPHPPQNPTQVPFKMQLPLALRNRVTGKGSKVTDQGCLYEATLIMGCLQQNNFEDKLCTKEATNFQNCYKRFLANNKLAKEQALKGVLTPNTTNLKYNQLNILLKKYPQV